MEKKDYLKLIFGPEYYTIDDLRYNQKLGFLFSKDELAQFLKEKEYLIEENNEDIEKLPLKTFNSKYCFYIKGNYLLSNYFQYLSTFVEDFKANQKTLFVRNADDIMMSRAFSEIEGTLNVENVPTTHKRVKDIYQKKTLTDKNDIIVKNMIDAMQFIVKEKPSFDKENLLKLYNILSFNCLDDEDKLKEGTYYRDEGVLVGGFEGAPDSMIEECMDSLFTFVNNSENVKKYGALLPHICHYYILYIHPYFDYNGRTARMVSFWLNYIFDINDAPLFMSEAINDNKKEYYRAITNTRNTYNDLTYFLGYILETAIKYSLVYKNLEEVKEKLSKTGDTLTSTEWGYLKKIIIHNSTGYFTYKDFFEYIHSTMTKQGGLKILNAFVEYNLLIKDINKKKEAIYKVNPEILTYKFQK